MAITTWVWVGLAAFSALSLIVRRPWTLVFARRTTPKVAQETPVFLQANYAMTAGWTAYYALGAVVSLFSPLASIFLTVVSVPLGILSPRIGAMYAGGRIRRDIARSSESGGPSEAPRAMLTEMVKGKTDDEIIELAKSLGSIENFIDVTFEAMPQALDPDAAEDCVIGYEISHADKTFAYRVEVKGSDVLVAKRAPSDAAVSLLVSVPTYLRLITNEIDGTQAFMQAKVKLQGDLLLATRIQKMFSRGN